MYSVRFFDVENTKFVIRPPRGKLFEDLYFLYSSNENKPQI